MYLIANDANVSKKRPDSADREPFACFPTASFAVPPRRTPTASTRRRGASPPPSRPPRSGRPHSARTSARRSRPKVPAKYLLSHCYFYSSFSATQRPFLLCFFRARSVKNILILLPSASSAKKNCFHYRENELVGVFVAGVITV